MRKRLRKKLRRGEFTEYGFELLALTTLSACDDPQAVDDFIDRAIELAEHLGLGIGGGFLAGERFEVFVTSPQRGGVDAGQREDFVASIGAFEGVISVEAGKLVDAWR